MDGATDSTRAETLVTLRNISKAVAEMSSNVEKISASVLGMDRKMRALEGKMGLMYTPFMTSMYEHQQQKKIAIRSSNAPAFQ